MDADELEKLRLPPLEEVLTRSENFREETPVVSNATSTSHAPRFYYSTCIVKKEFDGKEDIQVDEEANENGVHAVVCRYAENHNDTYLYCNRMYKNCPHSGS